MMHVPVLLDEVILMSGLDSKIDALGLDVTFGLGGHSRELLEKFPSLKMLAIDKDDSTRTSIVGSFNSFGDRIQTAHLCFSELVRLEEVFSKLTRGEALNFEFILADLGISSVQLDSSDRGLSYRLDSPLDMRMDQTQALTADIVLNQYAERDLFLVFARGGVGTLSKALAKAIVQDRPIESTKKFHAICNSVLRGKSKRGDSGKQSDLATVPFQAVRIEVNNEFENLKIFLVQAVSRLKSNGRLLIISFHSLEDKIVTSAMRWWSSVRGKGLHKEDGTLGKLLTKKAICPTNLEISSNSRSRSAMLRVFERNDNLIWEERSFLPGNI